MEKATKTQVRYFTVMQWEQEQEYLQKMHRQGWKFTGVTMLGVYHFEKCEPEDVVYQLDYNEEGMKNKEEYLQIFRDCGWEYLQDYFGYSYFRKPVAQMAGEEKIFCDDESRRDMMKRVFRGRVIPLILLFCCVILPQLMSKSHQNGEINHVLFGMFFVLFLLYLAIFLSFAYQYWKWSRSR